MSISHSLIFEYQRFFQIRFGFFELGGARLLFFQRFGGGNFALGARLLFVAFALRELQFVAAASAATGVGDRARYTTTSTR